MDDGERARVSYSLASLPRCLVELRSEGIEAELDPSRLGACGTTFRFVLRLGGDYIVEMVACCRVCRPGSDGVCGNI